jgi:hypothetical protein
VATFWEQAVQLVVAQMICAWLPARAANDPGSPAAVGTGPFLLFRRAAYDRIGGHAAVRAEVVEDLALAQAVKRAGLRLLVTRAPGQASLRMYDSLAAIVRGWSKNFHVALGGAPWMAPLLAAGMLLVYAGPFLLPPLALVLRAWSALAVALLAMVSAIAARRDLERRFAVSARRSYLAALGAPVVAWILLRAAWRVLLGRPIDWRGRMVR